MGGGTLPGMATARNTRTRATTGDSLKPVVSINIDDEDFSPIPVKLGRDLYKVVPPKGGVTMALTRLSVVISDVHEAAKDRDLTEEEQEKAGRATLQVVELMRTWVLSAFGEDGPTVLDRLESVDDSLDYNHIRALMEALTEAQTANPTS